MRILLVEDDARLAADMAGLLRREGYVVDVVADGREAWFQGEVESHDAVLLDLGLPHLDGASVLARLRAAGRTQPVIVVSARDSWADKVALLDAGADDFLVKPVQPEELLARLRAALRRAQGAAGGLLAAGPLTLDPRRRVALAHGVRIALTPLEWRVLWWLASRRGDPATAGQIADHVYEDPDQRDLNAVEAVIARLRRKLPAGLIETRRGHGYALASAEPT